MYRVYMVRLAYDYEMDDEDDLHLVLIDSQTYRKFLVESWYTEELAKESVRNLNDRNDLYQYFYKKE